MGGGDLNLKKSWDPRRLDNKEEKWKREEQDKSERRKMKELLAERTAEQSMEEMSRQGQDTGVLEKRKDRVDWMYKGPEAHTNPDDYLLGKKIDKDIVKAQSGHSQTSESQGGLASTSSILGGSANSALDAKDMARKMREDPLFAIKKRELNNRKELVNNPIRMKQLQQMLQTQVGKDKKKSKKAKRHKEKKEKKHKKPALSSDESSSEDNVAPSHSRKRHQNRQRSADRSRMKNRKGQSRRLETSSDSSSESDSDDAKPGRGGKGTMTSLDPARIKKLLEQEMLKKQSRHERVSDSSSRESDSDEKSSGKHRRNKPSRQPGRENFKVEQKHKYESREHERNQKERKPEEGLSPRKSKRRSFSEEEGSPVKYGLQKRARSLRLETPVPERQHKDHSRRHQRTERHRGKSPYEDYRPSQKSQHGCRENRSQSQQPRHRDIHSDRQGDKYRGERNRSRSPRKQSADKYKRSRSRSPSRQSGGPKSATAKRKLTAEEMERKRAEMMDNAKWRDDQRKERVKIYEKEEKAEAEMEKKKAKNAEFVQPLKLQDNSSVEDRIHRNIYNIQRTNAALDKNFAKR